MKGYTVIVQVVLCVVGVFGADHGSNGIIDDSPQARMLFHLADGDNSTFLTHAEFHDVFKSFDADGDHIVSSKEFLDKWTGDGFGEFRQGLQLYLNFDVNKDVRVDETTDIPHVFVYFDRNHDMLISEGEFVIQWVKISL